MKEEKRHLMLCMHRQTLFSKGYRKPQKLSASFTKRDQNSEAESYTRTSAVFPIVSKPKGTDQITDLILAMFTLETISNI